MDPGPVLVDDFKLPGFVESVPWNDKFGRRAAVLMTEALSQLPDKFLEAVDGTAVVRAQSLGGKGAGILGMHLPLLQNAVLMGDSVVRSRPYTAGSQDPDHAFVRTFSHELAHVTLTRQALSSLDKLALVAMTIGSLGLAGLNGGGSLLLFPGVHLCPVFQSRRTDGYLLGLRQGDRLGGQQPQPAGHVFER